MSPLDIQSVPIVRCEDPLLQVKARWHGGSDEDQADAARKLSEAFKKGEKELCFKSKKSTIMFLISYGGHMTYEANLNAKSREGVPRIPIIRSQDVWPQIQRGLEHGSSVNKEDAKSVLTNAIKFGATSDIYFPSPACCFPSPAARKVVFVLVRQCFFDVRPPPSLKNHRNVMEKYPTLRFEAIMSQKESEAERRYFHENLSTLQMARLWLHSMVSREFITRIYREQEP